MEKNFLKKISSNSLKFLLSVSLISALWMYLLYFGTTPLTWPAVDNLPAICRLLDSTCLSTDFFTNASSTVNPRFPFTYLLWIVTKFSANGLGGGLGVIKAFLLVLFPFLLTFTIAISIRVQSERYLKSSSTTREAVFLLACIFAPIIIFLLQGRLGAVLSVAWWSPLYFEATPHNLSITLTLLGFCVLFFEKHSIGFLLIFLGGIIHPAACILTSIFAYILHSKVYYAIKENRSLLIFGLLPSLLSALCIKIIFDAGVGLSAQEFIKIYVIEAHPSHFLPTYFGSLSRFPWFISFFIVQSGLIITSFILYKLNCEAYKNSVAATVAYGVSVLAQYIFIEIWPVKLIAILGPSRFTLFGPWLLFIFFLLSILIILSKLDFFKKIESVLFKTTIFNKYLIVSGGVFLVILAILFASKPPNFDFIIEKDKPFFEFIKNTSGKADVFILPVDDTRVFVPLITGRSVFFGNGFPFSEDFFDEYSKRKKLVSGDTATIKDNAGSWIGEKQANYYQSLNPKNFVEISKSYKINWVVIEQNHADSFKECRPRFNSKKYKIFEIQALEECTK